jgi:type II secretory pathway pseudopilin PulG
MKGVEAMPKRKRLPGFTLVEIMVVAVAMLLMAGAGFTVASRSAVNARFASSERNLVALFEGVMRAQWDDPEINLTVDFTGDGALQDVVTARLKTALEKVLDRPLEDMESPFSGQPYRIAIGRPGTGGTGSSGGGNSNGNSGNGNNGNTGNGNGNYGNGNGNGGANGGDNGNGGTGGGDGNGDGGTGNGNGNEGVGGGNGGAEDETPGEDEPPGQGQGGGKKGQGALIERGVAGEFLALSALSDLSGQAAIEPPQAFSLYAEVPSGLLATSGGGLPVTSESMGIILYDEDPDEDATVINALDGSWSLEFHIRKNALCGNRPMFKFLYNEP